ncbi:secreted insulinase-like peptidase [Cryptosporidium ubiquitum]|uniref:Secreted insulinase-like peptidase n=1 Tax=Cryptosporidium ubiquitum TaxID=857276 RepID=A0A1J4MMY7_9CRYT|nr:secreted insulinase-like peptidase [Cryptosporidium ubiquitum]OII74388.1 secreted insulinase-like peptidase [Cryptosporidium ubiquitum]
MLPSLRLIVLFIPLFFIHYFLCFSNEEILPFNFTDVSSKGNEIFQTDKVNITDKEETKNENSDIIYETSVYFPSIKLINDQSFKIVKLSNNIEVILNSVPKMDECEISILNRVGSVHEPLDLHGLGFYLMNIMVSTSKNNPSSGLYDFSMDNSISLNYQPYSTYSIFDIITTTKLFENTLKHVSEMFKTPIFSEEVMEKAFNLLEKKNSENNHLVNSHLSNLVLSDPKSIFSRNKYGNRNTLKTVPQSKDINVKQSLIKFFNEQYSSNKLILSVKSALSIETMQNLVKKYFIDIPNKKLPINDQHKPFQNFSINPFSYSVGKILFSIDDNSQTLELIFPLKNYLLPYMKSDPLFFIKVYICENRDGSLMRYLNQKKYISNMVCIVKNSLFGFTNVHFVFYLNNSGAFNINNIIRAFFFAINKTKELKLDLNFYKKTKQEHIEGIQASAKYFYSLKSYILLDNYFKYKTSTFKSLLLGVNEFSDFDNNLHRQVLMDIKPENLIIVLNSDSGKASIEYSGGLNLFEQSITEQNCSKYEQFLKEQKSFTYIALTNILPKNFKSIVKTNDKFRYILQEQNYCLKKYFSNFPESLSQELKIYYKESEKPVSRVSMDSYSKVKQFVVPRKLSQLLSPNSSNRAGNFSQFKDFYYYIPHESPTRKIYLAINFFFPFENEKLNVLRSARIAAIILFFNEILISFSEAITSKFAKYSVEFIPSVSLPKDSIINVFGVSLIIAGFPNVFSKLLSTLSTDLNAYIDLNQNLFKDFHEYFKKHLASIIVSRQHNTILSDFLNQINTNHKILTDSILNEAKTLTIEEVRTVVNAIFKQSQVSGVIYGNLTPFDAEKYLSQLFSEFIGEAPKIKTSRFKTRKKIIMSSRTKYSRIFTKIGSRRSKNRRITLTKKLGNSPFTKLNLTKKLNKTSRMTEKNISSRSELYKVYSSKFSRSNSEMFKDLQILDMSSIKPNSKFFFQAYSDNIAKNVSILWIYIDKASPESFLFSEYLKYIIDNRLSADQKHHNGLVTHIKDYVISSTSYFISIEGRSSSEDFFLMNDLLSSYVDQFFSSNSLIFNEELFKSAKEFLSRKYKKEGVNIDLSLNNLFGEIKNQRFDFVRFRSIANLLDELTFEQFTLNLKKIHKSTFSIIFSIFNTKSQSIVPNGYTYLSNLSDIFKFPGIKTFKPAYSRVDKQLSKLPEQKDCFY